MEGGLAIGVAVSKNVDSVESEKMHVHVESNRRIKPLDERDRAGVRVVHARKPELSFRPTAKRATDLAGEDAAEVRDPRRI